ncbi:RNA-binding domain-containing protein [Streptomyces sp. NBC_01643]|uniref:AlbA family DNA-binding domain-containing protein n=1 Tax=Streptomyces sp. NBC_01643 TaxID=2975906 RepID=UPI002F90ED64|nr:ATP-binding protein [Streptomyces sp. NBC_01643]
MPASSRSELITFLAQGKPEELLGTPECEWVDFKSGGFGAPYDLRTPKGKFELSKDIAAFANSGGGLIVCGVTAKQRANELVEVATKLTPFQQSLIKIDQFKTTIDDLVRPLIKVSYHWFAHPASDDDLAGHYFVLDVEALPEADRWALVRKVLNDNDQFTEGWTVPIRHDDRTTTISADDAYRLMNDGLRSRTAPPWAAPAPTPPSDPVQARHDLEAHLGWDELPVLFWQSTPQNAPELINGLHSQDGIRGALLNQDAMRPHGGFNFSSDYKRPEPYRGGLLLADSRRAVAIAADGTVTAAVVATSEMLGWSMEQRFGETGRINVVTLSELMLEYFRLVDEKILPAVDGPWQHRIVAARFAQEPARVLAPGANPEFPLIGAVQQASADKWNQSWTAHGDPEQDAYEGLQRVYALFGLDASQNPYVEDKKLSTALLQAAFTR